MTEDLAFALAMGVAAVCGAVTGRIFALEADDRRTSILAAAYCGAGAGLMSGPVFAFVLVLVADLLRGQAIAPALSGAAQMTGPALLWGIAAGAAGGCVAGVAVALVKRYSAP
jgi:hypothetical protein